MVSLPAPPETQSAPSPPLNTSLPPLPMSTSAPSLPLRVSLLPSRPIRMSANPLPLMVPPLTRSTVTSAVSEATGTVAVVSERRVRCRKQHRAVGCAAHALHRDRLPVCIAVVVKQREVGDDDVGAGPADVRDHAVVAHDRRGIGARR